MPPSIRWCVLLASLLGAIGAAADVSYTEEIVNAGIGPKHRGARRTVHEIQIQGQRQRVQTQIETSEEMRRILEKRGVALQGMTILRLDQGRVYEIDPAAGTYRTQPLPPPPPPAKPAEKGAAKPAAPAAANREITVRSKVLPDTSRIVGIPCRRVAAQMLVRHFKPGTQKVVRVNRYLYQAWMAEGFAGYDEIMAFRRAQENRTSLAPLVRGGLDQWEGDGSADAERLEAEVAALQGFPLQSELTVQTTVGSGKPKLVFKLSRKVLSLTHQALPESLFRPSRELKSIR